jgi:hypothetical protein
MVAIENLSSKQQRRIAARWNSGKTFGAGQRPNGASPSYRTSLILKTTHP